MTDRDAYTNPAYQGTRRAILTAVRQGEGRCAAPECLYERDAGTRDIHPDSLVNVLSNDRGIPIGPAHFRCIQSDRAKRGHKQRAERFLRL